MKFPLPRRLQIDANRLQSKLNYGYLVAMSISVIGSLTGMVIADYFQGQGIEKLHQSNAQATLFRQFRDASQQAQLQGSQFRLILQRPEAIRAYQTRLRDNTERVNQLQADIIAFAERYPQWLSVPLVELELITQNYVNAINAQEEEILALFPTSVKHLSPSEQERLLKELRQIERRIQLSATQSVEWKLDRALNAAEYQSLAAEAGLETAQGIEKTFIVFANLLSVVLGGIYVWRLSKRLLAPIETLTQTTQAIAQNQDFSLRTPVTTTDEAGQLAEAFNRLIAAIETQTQELTTAKEHAEAASHAKSTFLATMTHELRTPLNAVLGYTHLLLKVPQRDPQEQDALETIARSGQHLLNLVNDVLHISRVDAGKATVTMQDCNFRNLLKDIEDMFALSARQKQLELNWRVAQTVPHYLRSDATKLRQILINLVGNALKFTQKGQVTVQIQVVEHDPLQPRLHIQVIDTGMGIAAHEIPTLFEPFTQTRSGRELQQGTGLGLALCYDFAQLLGGTVTVESQEGVGSKFTVDLPYEAIAPSPIDRDESWNNPPDAVFAASHLPSVIDEAEAPTMDHYLSVMGESWCRQLHQAALIADAQELEALIAQVPPTSNELSTVLNQWIADYRFDQITQLFEPLVATVDEG